MARGPGHAARRSSTQHIGTSGRLLRSSHDRRLYCPAARSSLGSRLGPRAGRRDRQKARHGRRWEERGGCGHRRDQHRSGPRHRHVPPVGNPAPLRRVSRALAGAWALLCGCTCRDGAPALGRRVGGRSRLLRPEIDPQEERRPQKPLRGGTGLVSWSLEQYCWHGPCVVESGAVLLARIRLKGGAAGDVGCDEGSGTWAGQEDRYRPMRQHRYMLSHMLYAVAYSIDICCRIYLCDSIDIPYTHKRESFLPRSQNV